MSLVDDNRKHSRSVSTMKQHAKLILSKELIMQVHYLHHVVKASTEWSGVLIYSVVEGDVDKPSELVLLAEKLLPMDVGTSGYTEYEFSPDSPHFDEWCDALEAGKKIGHIHTHHNMGTFFSGTDMSELHDNAPNHNFYLSLIVDYKAHDKWCAKVAIDGEEIIDIDLKVEGYRKTTGFSKTLAKWMGHSGPMEARSEQEFNGEDDDLEDFTEETKKQVTKPMLYVIDMDLELAEDAKAWEDLVSDLNSKSGRRITTYSGGHGSTIGFGNVGKYPWEKEKVSAKSGTKGSSGTNSTVGNTKVPTGTVLDMGGEPFQGDFWDDWAESGSEESDPLLAGSKELPDNTFSPEHCRTLLGAIIKLDPTWDGDLTEVMTQFNKEMEADSPESNIWYDAAEDVFEQWAAHSFTQPKLDPEMMHCLVTSMFDLLEPFKKFQVFDLIERFLDVYIMPHGYSPTDEELFRLTGIIMIDEDAAEIEEILQADKESKDKKQAISYEQ